MTEIPQDRILNVKSKPELKNGVELKSLEDLNKLIKVGNLVCLYEDQTEKVYFIQDFFYKQKK
jgi:hypothetical protein